MATRSKTRRPIRLASSLAIVTTAVCFFLLASGTVLMQAKKPYEKETLLKVVELNALPTQEITEKITERGVAFKMTSDVDGEFRRVGARPEVLDAIRANYRPASPPPVVTPPTKPKSEVEPPSTGGKAAVNVPAGPPLSKDQIVAMLQSGAPPDRVERFVEVRGVSFTLTKESTREITAAGGNRALLGAIGEKAPSGEAGSSTRPPETVNKPAQPVVPVNRGPSYEDLTDQAIAAMGANNPSYAVNLLQQAVRVDPNQPQAYQLLGWSVLYNNRDVNSADRFMRAAIDRNGSAAFKVFHDHDGFFNTYCIGSFFVSKGGVSFRANDGNHTFGAEKSVIKEAKTNALVGAQWGAFHIKVTMANGKSQNYNFVPATYQIAESNLLLALLKSY